MTAITESKILIMATDDFEEVELTTPLKKLREAGATVHVATLDGEKIKAWDQDHWSIDVAGDLKIADVKVEDYDAIVLPGGQINPDLLRVEEDAINVIKGFVTHGKIVAAICHAPWLLIEADVVKGREMTSYKSIRTDLKNAGAHVVDKPVAISNGIITSRNPDDLDAFVAKIIEEVREGNHKRNAA